MSPRSPLHRHSGARVARIRNLEIPRCAMTHLRSGPPDHPGMTESLDRFGFSRLAMTVETGWRKWQKIQKRLEFPQANACAAASASRSTRRRAGPGTIIRLAADARMARLTRPMSEAG